MTPRFALGLALLSSVAGLVPTADGQQGRVPPAYTAHRVAGRIALDGRFDEPDWLAAARAGEFVQVEPVQGGAVTAQTDVRVLFDRDNEPPRVCRRLG